ncbi:MAG TPA: hypothetical protein VGO62_04160 [Myxococcota bacterium]
MVFPIFGLALLLPKLQILWWSIGRGVALLSHTAHHVDVATIDHDAFDAFDEYPQA